MKNIIRDILIYQSNKYRLYMEWELIYNLYLSNLDIHFF